MQHESTPNKAELISEIQRRLKHLLSTQNYSRDEKSKIIREFFRALESTEE
jgi:hypothetical protein